MSYCCAYLHALVSHHIACPFITGHLGKCAIIKEMLVQVLCTLKKFCHFLANWQEFYYIIDEHFAKYICLKYLLPILSFDEH